VENVKQNKKYLKERHDDSDVKLNFQQYSMLYVFTIATHEKGYYSSLLDSCKKQNIELNVVGLGQKWKGFQTKLKLIQQTLESLTEDTICLFTDAYDSIIIGTEQEIIDRYYQLNEPIVFSSYTGKALFVSEFFFGKTCGKNESLNSGGFIGRVKELKQFFKDLCQENKCIGSEIDDQKIINQYCNESKPIPLDTQNTLFYIFEWENLLTSYTNIMLGKQSTILPLETDYYKIDKRVYCKKTNSFPIILHANNSGNMDLILKQLDIKNDYKKPNYFQYSTMKFIMPILLKLLCIIVIVYILYKSRLFHNAIQYIRKYNGKKTIYHRRL